MHVLQRGLAVRGLLGPSGGRRGVAGVFARLPGLVLDGREVGEADVGAYGAACDRDVGAGDVGAAPAAGGLGGGREGRGARGLADHVALARAVAVDRGGLPHDGRAHEDAGLGVVGAHDVPHVVAVPLGHVGVAGVLVLQLLELLAALLGERFGVRVGVVVLRRPLVHAEQRLGLRHVALGVGEEVHLGAVGQLALADAHQVVDRPVALGHVEAQAVGVELVCRRPVLGGRGREHRAVPVPRDRELGAGGAQGAEGGRVGVGEPHLVVERYAAVGGGGREQVAQAHAVDEREQRGVRLPADAVVGPAGVGAHDFAGEQPVPRAAAVHRPLAPRPLGLHADLVHDAPELRALHVDEAARLDGGARREGAGEGEAVAGRRPVLHRELVGDDHARVAPARVGVGQIVHLGALLST